MNIRRNNPSDHESLMESMLSLAESDKPQIGIFWYDDSKIELFGVHKADWDSFKDDGHGRRIYPTLHYQVWNKDNYRRKAHNQDISQYKGSYQDTYRGRVNYENGEFLVYVGDWIDTLEPKLTPLIKAEFNLEDFDYIIDEHWNLHHGFSGDRFN